MRAVPQPVVQGLSASSGATKEPFAPTRPTRAKSHQRRYPDQHRSPPFRRRFDAHELYLLSVLFDVPIAYFFVPPPGSERTQIADTGDLLPSLYAAVLGRERQLAPLDERLAEIGLQNPDEADQALVAVLGPKTATGAWHDHFRTWRKRRLRQLEKQYGDRLDEVADFLAKFAAQIKAVGPKTYLESVAYNDRDAKRDRRRELDKLSSDHRS